MALMTETWLSRVEDVNLSLICLPGFSIWYLPQTEGQRGGVTVVYWNNTELIMKPGQQQQGLECLTLGLLLVDRCP